jgi:hypothetical protein
MLVTPTAMAMVVPTVMVRTIVTAKAMADATSVNCSGKHDCGNNNGDGMTATVTAMTATATATVTAMATTKVAGATVKTEI